MRIATIEIFKTANTFETNGAFRTFVALKTFGTFETLWYIYKIYDRFQAKFLFAIVLLSEHFHTSSI